MKISMKFIITTAILMGIVGTAQSRTILVPGDYAYIGEGVRNARANDTVLVRRGTYRLVNDNFNNLLVTLGANVTLISEEGPTATVIDAEGTPDTVGYIMGASSKINGFTFTRFTHSAILIANANNARVTNCVFLLNVNRSNNMGGQLKITGSQDPIVEHCIFQQNAAGSAGGGIHVNSTSLRVKIWDCIFDRNETSKFGGGVAIIGNSTAIVGNCLFTGNFVTIDGGGISFTISSSGTVSNCSFVGNSARNGGGGGLYKGSNSNPTVIHSIFWENDAGRGRQLWQQNDGGGAGGQITINYCCVQGGVDQQDGGWNGNNIIDDNPWFAEGRMPLWGLNFFYLDQEASSCIDAGSETAAEVGMDTLFTSPELVLDTGMVDLGFHYDIDSYLRLGHLRGYVLSAFSGEGVWGCRITTSKRMEAVAEQSGFWEIRDHRMGDLWVSYHHDAFLDTTIGGLFLEEDQTLDIRNELLHTEFTPSIQEYVATVDSGTVRNTEFSVTNGGSGVLTYRATPQLVGGNNIQPWTLRESFQAAQTLGDNRINGVVFVDSLFYVTGANDNDTNLVYILDRTGALIDSFPQMGLEHYGMKGLTYGQDVIWGAEGNTVIGYDRQGNVQTSFVTPVNSIEGITYDIDRNVLWLCGISSDFVAVNLDGSDAGLTFSDNNLNRKYGMAYWPGDPDGKPFYFINRITTDATNNRHFIYKVNPDAPQDTVMVAELPEDPANKIQGGCIFQWDLLSMVYIDVADVSIPNGGDRIQVWQLAGNTAWMRIEPITGEIMPTDMQIFTLTLDMPGFPLGRYEGQIFFTHNALDNQFTLPIVATLRRPGAVEFDESTLPVSTGIEAVHPNPFNGLTTMKYNISTAGRVRLGIYDLAGREIARLIDGETSAGSHSLTIDAQGWASGIYIAKLESAGTVHTGKIVLLR